MKQNLTKYHDMLAAKKRSEEINYYIASNLDLAIDVVGTMKMLKINEAAQKQCSPQRYDELMHEIDVLSKEEILLYSEQNQTIRAQVLDRVIKEYGTILKQYYATK